jgi:hypothetical protein
MVIDWANCNDFIRPIEKVVIKWQLKPYTVSVFSVTDLDFK